MDTDLMAEVERRAESTATWVQAVDAVARYGTVADALEEADELPAEVVALIRERMAEDSWTGWADAVDILNNDALSVELEGTRPIGAGDWTATAAVIVTGTGGPHTEVRISLGGSNYATAHALWGRESAEEYAGPVPYLAGWLDDLDL
jgi:hypothetical protein